mgnify:CR=1 FL=1
MSEQILKEVLSLLDEVLSLDGRALAFAADTPLLGDLPELDSMAVAGLLTEMEDRLGILIEDDEVDGELFENFGNLVDFARAKAAA